MSNRNIWSIVAAGGAGLIFGIGLAISRMTDPEKVKSFLDVATIGEGTWDPSLIFVMGGGLIVTLVFYRLTRTMQRPLISLSFSWPTKINIDRPLVIGSAMFGVGWGLSGLCPGPAIASLGLVPSEFILFAVAMLVGSWTTSVWLNMRGSSGNAVQGQDVAAE